MPFQISKEVKRIVQQILRFCLRGSCNLQTCIFLLPLRTTPSSHKWAKKGKTCIKTNGFISNFFRNIAFSQTRMSCCTDFVHYSGRADGLCYPKHSGNTWYQTTRLWGVVRKGSKNMHVCRWHEPLCLNNVQNRCSRTSLSGWTRYCEKNLIWNHLFLYRFFPF
jgi:hypothetical protein